MPFKSEAQRRYLWANEPEIARDWTETYGSRIQKNNGGIMRVPFRREDYIAQSKEKAKIHNLTVDHVRKRNEDEYRRFRKWLINFPWRKIP